LKVETGGRIDTAAPAIPLNCTKDGSGSTDVVTCTWDGFLLSSNPQGGDFDLFVKTPAAPATSMTSTATISGTLAGVPLVDDSSDNTATVVTALSPTAPCGTACTQGFVPNGGSISRTSSDGTIAQTLTVPSGPSASWTGGGLYVTLEEKSTAGFTCGSATQLCSPQMAHSRFRSLSGNSPSSTQAAVKEAVTYIIKNVCNGAGNPGCFPLFYTITGQLSGIAPQQPGCPQSTAGNVFDTSGNPDIPCLVAAVKGTVLSEPASNSVTYTTAMRRDPGLPPLLPGK
jgi:hypothetical protein